MNKRMRFKKDMIAVYSTLGSVIGSIRRPEAIALIEQGSAKIKIGAKVPFRAVEIVGKRCGQGDIYTAVAIEENRKILLGGLTRTEHKPAPFNKFTGARVGPS